MRILLKLICVVVIILLSISVSSCYNIPGGEAGSKNQEDLWNEEFHEQLLSKHPEIADYLIADTDKVVFSYDNLMSHNGQFVYPHRVPIDGPIVNYFVYYLLDGEQKEFFTMPGGDLIVRTGDNLHTVDNKYSRYSIISSDLNRAFVLKTLVSASFNDNYEKCLPEDYYYLLFC